MSVGLQLRLSLAREAFDLDLGLDLPAHGITALFGPSGSGKTTVLRCVAGLEAAARGLVRVNGEAWQDDAAGIRLPTWRRSLGYVFQEASLFDHLDVRGNLAYGLQRSRQPGGRQALDEAIALLGIESLLHRRPDQLSGGERQRVAIARALATQPRLLLLDEPLSALDMARRQDIMPWLERLRDEVRIPMLYVTHSVDEVARLSDQVVVLREGRVRAKGAVSEVLGHTDNPVSAGDDAGALVHARLAERDERWHLVRAAFDGGDLWARDSGHALGAAIRVRVLARDVSVQLQPPAQTSIQNQLRAVVESITPDTHPSQAMLRLRCGQVLLMARVTQRAVDALSLRPGLPVWALVKAVALLG